MPAENGFVPTPEVVADWVVTTAFGPYRPSEAPDDCRVLLPGLGTGNIYDAVRRYCTHGEGWYETSHFDYEIPECVGVENDPKRIREFNRCHGDANIEVREADFCLDAPDKLFDWVIANPPFIRYSRIDKQKREQYAEMFQTATNRFPIYFPFLEQAYRCLRSGGYLTFILPIAILVNPLSEPARDFIRTHCTGPIRYLPPQTFDEQIEVLTITIKKTSDDKGVPHLWLERLYQHEVSNILCGLDQEFGDIDDEIDHYYKEHKITERMVKRLDNRERGVTRTDDGRVIATSESEHQSGLADFSGGAN